MKTHINVFEITDQKPLLKWGKELMGPRREEALNTLQQEGIKMEGMYSFMLEGRHFIIGIMIGDDITSADNTREINKKHTKILKKVKKSKVPTEVLYSLGFDS